MMEPNGTSVLKLTVKVVGVAVCLAIVVTAVLAWAGRDVPEGLIALGAAGVGGLATLLNGNAHK